MSRGPQQSRPVQAIEKGCDPADCEPHAPGLRVRAIGKRHILRAGNASFRELQSREAVAVVGRHHELAAHCYANRPAVQQHPPWQHRIKAGKPAILLSHPGRNIRITPRIAEQYLAEIRFARILRMPAVLRVDAREQGGRGGDVVLGENANRRDGRVRLFAAS